MGRQARVSEGRAELEKAQARAWCPREAGQRPGRGQTWRALHTTVQCSFSLAACGPALPPSQADEMAFSYDEELGLLAEGEGGLTPFTQ